ncbi:uncharacterized protein LOC105180956 [Harpegnathos saltator]|uniref:uncharacterized protein LOC105180956 n=1 Tax=Harpegnathos saltator TaxID=610380 RepID=UPI00058AC377|nr:uncharacterized protein LOC105180956 [Harpegnathos saltator]XP_025162305.1 uncharacterized protein LOC105180956 [Harpegnathos saltator]XP_025162306.1 uncharacterized protein LOC105180956 [Harpegnathos saltator]
MRNVLLRSIYILLILRTLVAVGFPTNTEADDKTSLEKNSIIGDVAKNDAYASVESYMCIHIPPELKNCNFPSYHKNMENSRLLENTWIERRKRELLNDNKENMPDSSTNISETEKRFPRQRPEKIIIYEIQRCVPHRLPFILPWCTKEDLAAKENEIYRLTPFVRKNTSTTSLEHPDYDV